jgi:hypothetical protein
MLSESQCNGCWCFLTNRHRTSYVHTRKTICCKNIVFRLVTSKTLNISLIAPHNFPVGNQLKEKMVIFFLFRTTQPARHWCRCQLPTKWVIYTSLCPQKCSHSNVLYTDHSIQPPDIVWNTTAHCWHSISMLASRINIMYVFFIHRKKYWVLSTYFLGQFRTWIIIFLRQQQIC